MSIELLVSAVTLLISGVALYKAWRMAPADIAKKYQDIASQAAEDAERAAARAERFSARCTDLEQRLQTLELEDEKLKAHILELEKTLDEWQHGIELLVHQLKANHIQPVWTPEARNNK